MNNREKESPRGRASYKNLASLVEDSWEAHPRGDLLRAKASQILQNEVAVKRS